MKVIVKPEHIETGKLRKPQCCMIACAIKDAIPDATYVAVRTNGITVTRKDENGDGYRAHYSVPLKAARRIIAFDEGKDVEPFSFESKIIDEVPVHKTSRTELEKSRERTIKQRAELKKEGKAYKAPERIAGV